mmetsp:Transcript_12641/g.22940  ORF Transcript_12641/g.22940 Transcript_12641/m.22940 type:complete len:582 (+) Transcript_12641:78-1823(+)
MGCCHSEGEAPNKGGVSRQKSVDETNGLQRNLIKKHKNREYVWDKYQRGKLLGAGMTGSVHVGKHKETGELYAIKSINKRKLDPAQIGELKNEVDLLRRLDHPSIVRLYEVFEQGSKMYLIMQLLSGKDLGKARFKNELEVATVMYKICQAIAYCHANGICHRDIKLENFVFTSKNNHEDICVIDFGIGKKLHKSSRNRQVTETKKQFKRNMHTICGTPYYMSPQVLEGRYDEKCDCWALGVLAYILLTGKPPFNGRSKKELDNAIRHGSVRFHRKISHDAKEFISHLLKINTNERWSASRALKATWFHQVISPPNDAKALELEQSAIDNIMHYQEAGKLKKIALMIRAFSLQNKKIEKLKAAFGLMDTGNTGTLTKNELSNALHRHNIFIDSEKIFESLDVDGHGVISYTEFLAAALGDDLEDDRVVLKSLFDKMDLSKNGRITAKDLKIFLGADAKKFNVEELVSEADMTGSHDISYAEFVHVMTKDLHSTTSASASGTTGSYIVSRADNPVKTRQDTVKELAARDKSKSKSGKKNPQTLDSSAAGMMVSRPRVSITVAPAAIPEEDNDSMRENEKATV